MSVLLKMCPNCKGDLLDIVDQDNFNIYKCAQCSREFSKELFNIEKKYSNEDAYHRV